MLLFNETINWHYASPLATIITKWKFKYSKLQCIVDFLFFFFCLFSFFWQCDRFKHIFFSLLSPFDIPLSIYLLSPYPHFFFLLSLSVHPSSDPHSLTLTDRFCSISHTRTHTCISSPLSFSYPSPLSLSHIHAPLPALLSLSFSPSSSSTNNCQPALQEVVSFVIIVDMYATCMQL